MEIFGTWPWGKLITEYYIRENNLRFNARENKYVQHSFPTNYKWPEKKRKESGKYLEKLKQIASWENWKALVNYLLSQLSWRDKSVCWLGICIIWKVMIQFLTLSNYFLPTQQTFFFIVINKDGDLTAVQKYILWVNRLFWNVIPIVKHNTYVNISFTFYTLETNFNWTESALHISTSFQVIIVSIIGAVFYFFGILSQV